MAKFKGLDETLEDKVLVRKLLNSVPKKFLPIVATIKQYQDLDEMSFEEAIGRLTAYEERIKSQDTLEAKDQDKLLMTSSNNKAYRKWRGKDFNKEGKESMKWKNNPNARRASTSQEIKDKNKSRRSVCDYGREYWAKPNPGYIGKRIVKASLAQGHPTYVLMRRELGFEIEKLQMLLSFKKQGAHLVEGSFSDHQSLVDVVICTMSGVQFRSHNILLQLKLVDAIKEAGNVKVVILVFAFGVWDRPFKNGGYFFGNLSQFCSLVPPKERVSIYGDGNCKACFMDEDDVATYAIKTIDDPRMLNKTLYLRPDENIVTQNQLVEKWEKVSSKTLEKVHISKEDFLASMKLGDLL
nr:hypothetical protein [Tanacetum cinerariifolium]